MVWRKWKSSRFRAEIARFIHCEPGTGGLGRTRCPSGHGGRSVGGSRSVIRGDRPRCRSTATSPARSREARARRNDCCETANRSRRDRPTFTSIEPVTPRRNHSSTATTSAFPPHAAAASSQSSGTGPRGIAPSVSRSRFRGARFEGSASGATVRGVRTGPQGVGGIHYLNRPIQGDKNRRDGGTKMAQG